MRMLAFLIEPNGLNKQNVDCSKQYKTRKINRYSKFTDNQSVHLCFVCELCHLDRPQLLDATTINIVLNCWVRLLCTFIICIDAIPIIQCHHVIVCIWSESAMEFIYCWAYQIECVFCRQFLQKVNINKCQCYRALHKTYFPPSLTTAHFFRCLYYCEQWRKKTWTITFFALIATPQHDKRKYCSFIERYGKLVLLLCLIFARISKRKMKHRRTCSAMFVLDFCLTLRHTRTYYQASFSPSFG